MYARIADRRVKMEKEGLAVLGFQLLFIFASGCAVN